MTVDGLEYREGLNAVLVSGGTAANVIPDRCVVTVNYRFAPTRSLAEAEAHVREVMTGYDVTVVDGAAGALPGLDRPAAREFIAAVLGTTGRSPVAKAGLDGRGEVQCPGRAGGELRPRRPAPGAHPRRAVPRGADRAGARGAAHLAGRLSARAAPGRRP